MKFFLISLYILFVAYGFLYQWQHPPSPAEQKAYQEYLQSDQYQDDIHQEEPDWDYDPERGD